MVLLGALPGASLGILDTDAVLVPLVGTVPDWTGGATGIVVSGLAYRRLGGDCSCGEGCGDSCSAEG